MDESFDPQSSVTQKPNVFLAGLQLVDSLLDWVAGFILLTEEEQREAGIYLGR